jgi:hypothetical protein
MKKFDVVLAVIFLLTGVCGYVLRAATVPPEIIKVPEPYVVEKWNEPERVEYPVIIYEEKEVEKIVEVEKKIYSRDSRDWESISEFMGWLENLQSRTLVYPDADCDDFAMNVQRAALKDGYMVSCQLVVDGMLWDRHVSDTRGGHFGNLVVIKNDVYYLEPQNDSLIWLSYVD